MLFPNVAHRHRQQLEAAAPAGISPSYERWEGWIPPVQRLSWFILCSIPDGAGLGRTQKRQGQEQGIKTTGMSRAAPPQWESRHRNGRGDSRHEAGKSSLPCCAPSPEHGQNPANPGKPFLRRPQTTEPCAGTQTPLLAVFSRRPSLSLALPGPRGSGEATRSRSHPRSRSAGESQPFPSEKAAREGA